MEFTFMNSETFHKDALLLEHISILTGRLMVAHWTRSDMLAILETFSPPIQLKQQSYLSEITKFLSSQVRLM